MMHPLLNQMLMRRVIGIQHLNRLPPSLPLRRIRAFKSKARHESRQRRALRVHTCLHQLLTATEISIAVHQAPRPRHGGDPDAEQDGVPVVRGPFFRALDGGFVGFKEGLAFAFTLDGAFLFGCVFDVIGRGGAVGCDDGCKIIILVYQVYAEE